MNIGAWILLIAAQSCWAASYTLTKICLENISVNMVGFLRYSIAALIFLLLFLYKGFPKVSKKTWTVIISIGFLNFFVSPFLQVKALNYTQAVDTSILVLFEPIITVLFAAAILKEKISKQTIWVLMISVVGFALISNISFVKTGNFSVIRLFGNMIFITALVSEAFCSTLGKYFTSKMSALHAVGMLTIFGAISGAIFYSPDWTHFSLPTILPRTWMCIIFLSMGCSVFSYVSWFYVIAKIPVQYVALSLFLQPVIGSMLGALVLHEQITLKTIVGTIVICVTLIWWQIQSQRKSIAQNSATA